MLELKRDILLRLLKYFKKNRRNKLCAIFGTCQEVYVWRNHFLFDKSLNYSFRVKHGKEYAYGKNNTDIYAVFIPDEDTLITLFSSMMNNKDVVIGRRDISEFEFGIFSGNEIGNCFLYACSLLKTPPTIPTSVTSIGSNFLSRCVSLVTPPTVPSTVASIGDFFLSGCTSLTTPPTIPDSVEYIGSYFLYYCTSLSAPPTIPNSVRIIGCCFLTGCTSLTAPPTIPDSVAIMGHFFLSGCTSLTSLPVIPDSVKVVNDYFLRVHLKK